MTSIIGITRVQSNSNSANRLPNNVVPISNDVSQRDVFQDKKQPSNEIIEKAVSEVNKFVKKIDRNLEFSVDEASGRVIITVREPDTGKIVRQIPPEELLVIAKLVRENFTDTLPSGTLLADEG